MHRPLALHLGEDESQPFAVETKEGLLFYGLHGDVGEERVKCSNTMHKCNPVIEKLIRNFYMRDFSDLHCNVKEPSIQDRQWVQLVQESCTLHNGRYSVAIPFHTQRHGNSYLMFRKRFVFLDKQLRKNADFFEQFKGFLNDMLRNGYCEPCPGQVDGFFSPIFAVFHPVKNKIRVVQDFSAKLMDSP